MDLKSKLVLQSLGIILFCIIITRLDLAKVLSLISHLNPFYFIIANILFIPLLIIKSIRWQSLMNALNIKYSIEESVIIYAAAMFIGSITPGNLGDFIKALYLKEDGHPLGKSFVSVLLDRLFDVISIAMLASLGFLFLIGSAKIMSLRIPLMASALFLIAVIYAYKNIQYKTIIRARLLKLIPDKYKATAAKGITDFSDGLCVINAGQFTYATILTIIGWIIYFTIMYILALSIHLNIPFTYLVICISISVIITLIPVSISGIGTRDATLIVLFSYLGYSSESAVALSMILLAFYAVNLLICLVAWLIKPIDLSIIRKTT